LKKREDKIAVCHTEITWRFQVLWKLTAPLISIMKHGAIKSKSP